MYTSSHNEVKVTFRDCNVLYTDSLVMEEKAAPAPFIDARSTVQTFNFCSSRPAAWLYKKPC